MIRINLLPFRSDRKKENIRRQLSIFVLSLILAVVAIFGINFFLSSQIDDLGRRIRPRRPNWKSTTRSTGKSKRSRESWTTSTRNWR